MRGAFFLVARRWAPLVLVLACAVQLASCARIGPDAAGLAPPAAPGVPGLAGGPHAAPTPGPRTVTVTVSGDLLWHRGLLAAAADEAEARGSDGYEFAPMLAPVREIIADADVSVCHTEVPVAPTGAQVSGYPVFGSPPATVRATAQTGFDLCTTSSNHALDKGLAGIARTLDAMEEHGIVATGTWRTAADRAEPALVTTPEGVRVAVVSGTYSLNGFKLPADQAFAVAMLDTDDMVARARSAREAGADLVLGAMHAGTELVHRPNAQQKEVAEELTASGAFDLVYGHHAHVVQAVDRLNDTWVLYGLSNLIGQMKVADIPRGAYDGLIGRITFTESRGGGFEASGVEYIPTMVTRPGQGPPRVLPVNAALASGAGDEAALRASLERTRKAVHALGAQGLVEG